MIESMRLLRPSQSPEPPVSGQVLHYCCETPLEADRRCGQVNVHARPAVRVGYRLVKGEAGQFD